MAPAPDGMVVTTVVRHLVEVSMAVSGTPAYLVEQKCNFVAAYNTFTPPSLQFSCALAYFKDGTGSRLVSPPSATGRRLQQAAVYNLQMELEVASARAASSAVSSIASFQEADPPTPEAFMVAAAAQGVDPNHVEILSAPIARPRAVSELVYAPPVVPVVVEDFTGAIVAGVIGGIVGLVVVGAASYLYTRKRLKTPSIVPA